MQLTATWLSMLQQTDMFCTDRNRWKKNTGTTPIPDWEELDSFVHETKVMKLAKWKQCHCTADKTEEILPHLTCEVV